MDTMSNPLVSVIITTYNRSDLLSNAVRSVLEQTYENIEIIVVDDHSTDGTQELMEGFVKENDNIVYHRRKKNFGHHARPKNDGIKLAKGEYICFLDDDNEYYMDHVQALMNEMKRGGVDIVYGDRMLHHMEGLMQDQIGIHSDFSRELIMQQNYIDTSDTLIPRRIFFEIGGWDERYGKYADWNLHCRLMKAGYTFRRTPRIITKYNLHSQMKSVTVKTENDNFEKGINRPDWNPVEVEVVLPFLGEVKEPRIAVFSLTKDRLEYTKICFESMRSKAGYDYTHFVVDNGSTDGTKEWLQEETKKPDFVVVSLDKNIGISKGSNKALETIFDYGEYDIIIKVDNDCLFLTDDWLKKIVGIYKKNHMICMSPYPEGLRDNAGGAPRIGYGNVDGHVVGIVQHIGGLCHVAPANVYKKFRWDEGSVLHGMQDVELSQWLMNNGYTQLYIEDVRVEHFEGTAGQEKRYPQYFELRKTEKVTRPE